MNMGLRIYMSDLKDLIVEGTPYLPPVPHRHLGRENHFGFGDTCQSHAKKGDLMFTYGSAAKRKSGIEDLETSQYFHAKQLTWKIKAVLGIASNKTKHRLCFLWVRHCSKCFEYVHLLTYTFTLTP